MKKSISLFVLIAVLFVAPLWAADERAKTDRSSRTHTLIVVDDTNDEIRKLTSTANGLKVDASAGGGGVVDQGVSGVSDADPWNMMLRDSSGVELGLAASPFGVSLFDAASNLLGVTANPLVVDLGVNNDVTVTSGTIIANIGTAGTLALEATQLTIDTDTGNIATSTASIDTDTTTIASDTTSIDADTSTIATNTTGLNNTVSGNEQQVDVVTLPSTLSVDANNTTTTPLGSGATFTGTATDLVTAGSPQLIVTVFADQDSAASGVVLQFSQDGTNWRAGSTKKIHTLSANVERTFQFGPEAQFFRVVVTNGGTAQGVFSVSTMLNRVQGHTTMHRVGDTIDEDRSVIGITKALNMVQKPDLTFVNQKATAGGVAKVAISEYEVELPSGGNLLGQIGAESPHFVLDAADATTGWTALGDASAIATNTTHIEGTLALGWDKAGGTEVTSGLQKTIDTEQTPGHATDVLLHCMLYIQDAPDLATVDFGFMRVGEDSTNYLQFEVDGVDMAVGWNHKNFTLTSPTSQTGAGLSTGIIKYIAFGVVTNNAADTFADMLGDDFHYDETLSTAVVSAPSSDVQLGSVVLQDRNSNTKADVETDGSKKALHVMTNSMALESTLSTMDAKFVTGTDIGDTTNNNAAGAAAVFTQGQAADGAAVAGNPNRMAGKDAGGLTQDLAIASNGILPLSTARSTTTDNVADNLRGLMTDVDGASVIYHNMPLLWDSVGGNFDRKPGNSTDGTLVNLGANNDVTLADQPLPLGAPGQDHKAVIVTASAVEILAADAGRRFVTVCNAFTDLVALGNSDVTLNTAVATDGLVLAAAGAAGDGTGGCLTFETTTAIYAIGASASSKVNLLWGTN